MATSSSRVPTAACTPAAVTALPRTDPHAAIGRGRCESATGGRADPGPRMVPSYGSSATHLPSSVLLTPAAGDSALERLMRGGMHRSSWDGSPLPPTERKWPAPGAAYSAFAPPPGAAPSAVATTAQACDTDVDALLAQLAAVQAKVERLEHVVDRSTSPSCQAWLSRAPSPSSV